MRWTRWALIPFLVVCTGGSCGGGTSMRVYGVTPGEVALPNDVWIRGRDLDEASRVQFVSITSPVDRATSFL